MIQSPRSVRLVRPTPSEAKCGREKLSPSSLVASRFAICSLQNFSLQFAVCILQSPPPQARRFAKLTVELPETHTNTFICSELDRKSERVRARGAILFSPGRAIALAGRRPLEPATCVCVFAVGAIWLATLFEAGKCLQHRPPVWLGRARSAALALAKYFI